MTPFEIVQLVLRIALALVFVGMGVLHFVPGPARGMAAMIPPAVRVVPPRALVAFTGVCELAGGIGLLVPATRVAAAICLVVFLVAVFPANAYAAGKTERFGVFATPLVPRAVLQVVLIALCLVCAL
ncbi:DoxX family protein [Leifsonia virtsii]|uniref:DoxX family membrane protein n=1 Tax=Leifsonia virtsii TaxID=3035915 RepID=A0ABT8IW25_9MICO|nr:DoxX family membrane protein [Leifsonia virtsii]MDN4596567.1 DoxX family membrane protein [Leifsonia virtsii]